MLNQIISRIFIGLVLLSAIVPAFAVTVSGTPPQGTVGVPYSYTFTASAGVPPYTFTSTTLPAGLTLNSSTGVVSGTPAIAVQNGTVFLTVTDSAPTPASATITVTFQIGGAPATAPPSIQTATLPAGNVGTAYSQSVTASGGTLPYSWKLLSGSLPPGLTLTGTNAGPPSSVISGTPTTAGSYNFTVQVMDSATTPATATKAYTITIANFTITTASLPGGTVGVFYSQTIAASGGTPPYTYSVAAGNLPIGVTLNPSTGVLQGTPSAAFNYFFTIQAADAASLTAQNNYSVLIASAGPVISTTSVPNAMVGTFYSASLSISGGTPPYTTVVTSGTLPAGLTLSATGTISGTPTTPGTTTVTIQVTDSAQRRSSQSVTVSVLATPLSITTASLPPATLNAPYSQKIMATGGNPPYMFFIQGDPPPGMSLDISSGILSGTPTTAGSYQLVIAVQDTQSGAGLSFVNKTFTFSVSQAVPVTISTTSPLPAATVGTSYSQTFNASGGTGPYTYTIATGSLPGGLTLSSAGGLTGTPTTAGTFNFTVQAKDTLNATGTKAFTLTVNPAPLVITTASPLPSGSVDQPYSQTLAATGGTPAYTFALSGAGLPTGVGLSSAGVLSGTPKQAGSYSFTITATDSASPAVTTNKQFTLQINASPINIITPATLPSGTVGVPYTTTFTATGGTGTGLNFTTSDTPPPGLAFDATSLNGTPTTAGPYTFTLTFSDSGASPVSRTFSILINPAGLAITTTSPLPGATSGTAYSQQINATDGAPPYSFVVISGFLPTGVTLGPAGALAGTPTATGQFTFTIQVTDSAGIKASQTFTLVVAAAPLKITTTSLGPAQAGTPYAQTLAASGGTSPYTFSISSGRLPDGITLSSVGTFSGTPTTPGNFGFTVQVSDSAGMVSAQAFSLAVSPAGLTISTTSPLPSGAVGTAYSQTIAALGGTQPYTFLVTSGTLPTGLTLSTTGLLSGTPTTLGTSNFTIQVTDSQGRSASMAFSLAIVNATLAISTSSPLPTGLVGLAYSQAVTATGGTAPYTYSVTGGTLPPGIALSAAGTVSGTPTAAGTFNFTVQARDSVGASVSKAFSVTIGTGGVTVATASLPNATVGVAYSQTLTGVGGTAPYRYAIAGGSLPTGLALSAAGVLSGTPSVAGTASFTVQISDAVGATGTKALTLTVGGTSTGLTISTTSPLPAGTAGTPYSQTLAATGGTAPYNWTVSAGPLPPGLTLATGGALSGTPATAGSYSFTVRVSDATGANASQAFVLIIAASGPIAPSISAVVNGASFALDALAPGEIVTLFGSSLGPATIATAQTSTPGFLDTTLSETRVFFDGIAAPLIYVSDRQTAAIVPYDVAGKANTQIKVEYRGVQSQASTAIVTDTLPGIFSADSSGRGPGAILNQDYRLNTAANPAGAGSVVLIYVTGEGQTDPSGVNGKIAVDVLPKPKAPVTVTIGGQPAQVLYAGGAPGIVAGGMQINVLVPAGVSGSAVPVVVTVGSKPSQGGVTMSVR